MDDERHMFLHEIIARFGPCRLCLRRQQFLAVLAARQRDLAIENFLRWYVRG